MFTSRLVLGLLCCVIHVTCKPNGAPTDSCFYMTPRHLHPHTFRRVYPTRSMGLYNITVSPRTYRPDKAVKVTLWGPPFKGFIMVAAENGAKDWPTGMFYSEDGTAKRLTCLARGDTVTHQNNTYKDSVSVLWYGPENELSEHVQFIATVVVNMTIYYTDIRSRFVTLDPILSNQQHHSEGPHGVTMMDPWLAVGTATKTPLWPSGSQSQTGSGIDSLLSILESGTSGSQTGLEGAGEAGGHIGNGGGRGGWRGSGTRNGWGNSGNGGSYGDVTGVWNNWGNRGTTQSWWRGTTYNPYNPATMYSSNYWQQRRSNIVIDPPRDGALLWSPETGWSAWAQPNPLPPITKTPTTIAPPTTVKRNVQPMTKTSESFSGGVIDLLSTLLKRMGAM